MKVGLFLGYGPETILSKEGLGRYLGNLIRNLQISGNHVVIACPKWTLESINDLCEDFGLDIRSVDFIVANRVPVIWSIYKKKTKKRKRNTEILRKGFKFGIDTILEIFLSITNIISFFALCLIGVACALIILPFLILGLFIFGIFSLVSTMKEKNVNKIKMILDRYISLYENISENGIHLYESLYNRLLEKMQIQLVSKINRNKQMANVWYSPAVFWPVFNRIEGTKVVNVPDLVTEEFATKWGGNREILYTSKKCEETIEESKYFVTYSNYIKESLLVKKFGKERENIFVIPHSINDLSNYVIINSAEVSAIGKEDQFTNQYCKDVIEANKVSVRDMDEYISGYSFNDVRYLFYPSQARPHKNLLNLIKAYEILLRKKYIRLKLILTCNLNVLPEIKDYIIKNRLQYDILSFYNISTKGLAALYHQAYLVVNPTLYEGGFPFTFGEGMSVGVPSVMSCIPQVQEYTDKFELEEVLFDPYNIDDIVEKLEYGIENREHILEKEKLLYEWMKQEFNEKRTGDLYVQVFKYAVEKN